MFLIRPFDKITKAVLLCWPPELKLKLFTHQLIHWSRFKKNYTKNVIDQIYDNPHPIYHYAYRAKNSG